MGKRKDKSPIATRGAASKHAAKTQEERQEYKELVRFAPGAGETVGDTPDRGEGISAPPDIQGPAVGASGRGMRRIHPPASPAPTQAPWRRVVSILWQVLGVGGIVALVTLVFQYGRAAERIDNNTRNVKELGDRTTQSVREFSDRLGKEKDRVDGFVERLVRLETQVEIAVKSGASTVNLQRDVALLHQDLERQRGGYGLLAKRLEAVEARLESANARQGTPEPDG